MIQEKIGALPYLLQFGSRLEKTSKTRWYEKAGIERDNEAVKLCQAYQKVGKRTSHIRTWMSRLMELPDM